MKEDTFKHLQNSTSKSFIAPKSAQEFELTQINKFHTKGGTGFAAEDANSFIDRLSFKRVQQVGTSNQINGADRIVDGISIQTKYFETASQTINSAFGSDGYRYGAQLLEVPSDQYDDCVRLMREKISNGQVPGVSDPSEAERIVKKGSVSYKQAYYIARAGNIHSLFYDMETQAITSGYTFAISFAINYAQNLWAGQCAEDALKTSISNALKSGTTSFIAGIITAQILRTHTAAVGVVVARNGVKFVAQSSVGKLLIEQIAKTSLGKAVYGAAATNHIAKLLRTNTITTGVVTAVMAIPDFYRALFEGSISWEQFIKNTGINLSSVAGGAGGAWAGAAIGTIFGPVGTFVGGLIGAVFGGTVSSEMSKVILDDLIEDDAKRMLKILPDGLAELSADFLLSESEALELFEEVNKRVDAEFLREMFKSSDRNCFVYEQFKDFCEKVIAKRPLVKLPEEDTVEEILASVNDEISAEVGQLLAA